MRWRAALVTAALHCGLLAALMRAGSGGGLGEAVPQSLSVRLLAAPLRAEALPVRASTPAPARHALPALTIPVLSLAVVTPPIAAAAPLPEPTSAAAPLPVQQLALSPPAREPAPNRPAERSDCPPAHYPPLLRERGVEGLVRVRVQVGAQGDTLAVQLAASSGFRLLDEAALAQARACRWRPALADGQQVASWVEFPSRFSLQ